MSELKLPRILFVTLAAFFGHFVVDAFAQTYVTAKLGIQIISQSEMRRARSQDRLLQGDKIRVFIEPQFDAFVYVVHSDGTTASLLTPLQSNMSKTAAGIRLILPSAGEYYQVDGASRTERLTIICSSARQPEIEALFRTEGASHQSWVASEKRLLQANKIEMNEMTEKPIPIAGNVRDLEQTNDFFATGLVSYSGKESVIKLYRFRVQK